MDNRMAMIARAVATLAIWIFAVGAIALIGIFLAPEIGEDALGAIFMVLLSVVLTNGFIWDWGRGANATRRDSRKRRKLEEDIYDSALMGLQKRKRGNVSSRLSDLSDDELISLRDRLQSGEFDEGEIAHLLQD